MLECIISMHQFNNLKLFKLGPKHRTKFLTPLKLISAAVDLNNMYTRNGLLLVSTCKMLWSSLDQLQLQQ